MHPSLFGSDVSIFWRCDYFRKIVILFSELHKVQPLFVSQILMGSLTQQTQKESFCDIGVMHTSLNLGPQIFNADQLAYSLDNPVRFDSISRRFLFDKNSCFVKTCEKVMINCSVFISWYGTKLSKIRKSGGACNE